MRLLSRVWFWASLELLVLVVLAAIRAKLWTYGSDTGTFAQVVAGALHGMRNGVEDGSHFRYHWSPSLVLLWPLVALTGSALPLQIVQAAATVACAPLVAALARPYAGVALAERLGILTLLYPPLLALGFDEFHELGLFSVLVLGMFVAADRGRWLWFALCGLVALGLREDAALTLIFFGGALAWIAARPAPAGGALLDGSPRPGTLVAGTLLAAGGAAALLVYYLAIVPRFGGWRPSHFYVYPFADGPLALAVAPFVHPLPFVRAIFTFGRLTYVLEAFVPLLFLPLRSRVGAAGVARRRGRPACELRLRLAYGRSLRRTLDPLAARRDRDGRRIGRAKGEPARCEKLDERRRRHLRNFLDRFRPTPSAALLASVLPRSRRRAASAELRARERVALDLRRMVFRGGRPAAARDDR